MSDKDQQRNRSTRLDGGVLVAVFLGLAIIWGEATESAPAGGEQSLIRALAEEPRVEPMLALEGYLTETEFFIKYRMGDRVMYTGGNWRNRILLADAAEQTGADYTVPSMIPLEYHQAAAWAELPPDVRKIRILGIEHWQGVRDRLLLAILPPGTEGGVVLSFDHDDYFLFYDETGRFTATRLEDKPAEYRIQTSYHFNEFFRRSAPILEAYMLEQGIEEREFAFNTGDSGAYALPFVYGNLDKRVAVFGRFIPESMLRRTAAPVPDTMQTAGHVGISHIGGLFVRPVSSMYRLFFVVGDTAFDTARPTWLPAIQNEPLPPLNTGPPMDLDAWEQALDRITGRPSSTGTIDFLIGGEEFFLRFTDAVVSAKESVHLRTYIFDNDDFALKIGDLLKRRSRERVDVKILLDGLGTIFATGEEAKSQPKDHVPPPSVRKYLEADSNVAVRQTTNPWMAGDHVKTTIIDHKYAFIGGMNIGREYRYDWHDMMMELQGPVVNVLEEDFLDSWAHAGPFGDFGYLAQLFESPPPQATGDGYAIRVLFTKAGGSEIFLSQLEAIRRSQKFIYIQNAYFTDDAILYELAKARRRGVDVRVIIPLESDRGLLTRANAMTANDLLRSDVRVYIYPGMSHIKAAIYDGWACLGSANLDRLSLRINKEMNLATSDPAAVKELTDRLFTHDFERSPELTEPFPERWMDHLVEVVGEYIF